MDTPYDPNADRNPRARGRYQFQPTPPICLGPLHMTQTQPGLPAEPVKGADEVVRSMDGAQPQATPEFDDVVKLTVECNFLLRHCWGQQEHDFYFGANPEKKDYDLLRRKTNDRRNQIQNKCFSTGEQSYPMNFISSNVQTEDFEKCIERLARRAGIMRIVVAGETVVQREEQDTEATRCENLPITMKRNVDIVYDKEIERLEASRQAKNWSFLRFSENRRGLIATSKAAMIDKEVNRLSAQRQRFQNIAVPAADAVLDRSEPRLHAMMDDEARRVFWQERMTFAVLGSFLRPLLERIHLRRTMESQNMLTYQATYHCHMADVAYYHIVAPRLEIARAALIDR